MIVLSICVCAAAGNCGQGVPVHCRACRVPTHGGGAARGQDHHHFLPVTLACRVPTQGGGTARGQDHHHFLSVTLACRVPTHSRGAAHGQDHHCLPATPACRVPTHGGRAAHGQDHQHFLQTRGVTILSMRLCLLKAAYEKFDVSIDLLRS